MRKFIVGRLLSIIPVLIIVSVVIFSVVHLTPGDPAASILGDEATVEDIAALRAKMGLDKPVVEHIRLDIYLHIFTGSDSVLKALLWTELRGLER